MTTLLSVLATTVPFVAAAMTGPAWETMGLGAIAATLVGFLVKQNTDLSKAQADHQKELVKLVSDVSISQTVFADAIKDNAAANTALADAMRALAKAFERDTVVMERIAKVGAK